MKQAARIIVASIMATVAAMPARAEEMVRAASVSVCTDQYLVGLAASDQVAAVSWQATSARSPVRNRARDLPQIRGTAEELIATRADLVVVGAYGNQAAASALEALGVQVFRVTDAVTIADVTDNLSRLGAALRREGAADAMAATLQARAAALVDAAPEQRPLALYVSPGGGGAGAGTYVDEVLRLAGFRNLQAELGMMGWQRVPLERLAHQPPDVLILSYFESAAPSLADHFVRHPQFRALLETTPVIRQPAAPWVCAGPYLMDAAEQLARARERVFTEPRVAEARP